MPEKKAAYGQLEAKPEAAANKIPFEELHPDRMTAEERFGAYFDATSQLCDITIAESTNSHSQVFARSWLLDNLVLLDACVPAHTTSRRRKHIHRSQCDMVVLMCGPGRPTRLLIDQSPVMLDQDAFHLTDYSREQVEYCNDEEYSCVYLPYDVIGYDPSRHPAHLRVDFHSPSGRVLESAFRSLHEQLPEVTEMEAADLAAGFAGLVSGLLLGSASGQEQSADYIRTSRARAMRCYLDKHLGNPDLGAAELAQAFNVSRATVYRCFDEEGGLRRYVYSKRLERAYLDLAGGRPGRGRITRVAETWGFSSLGHFTRRFFSRYQCLPSDVLRRSRKDAAYFHAPGGAPSVHEFSVVGSWVRQLHA